MRPAPIIALATALAVLTGCTGPQTYSTPGHETLRLEQKDLREGGLAFLTPSTVTGQEEDKQSLAHVFSATLRQERPDIRLVALPETINAVNRNGLAGAYRAMYHDYRESGVFDAATLRQIGRVTGARYLAQLKLANMQQGARGRFGFLGLSLVQTQYANMRVFFQIWDSRDGTIAWEGIDEITLAIDTGKERPISFRAVAEQATKSLIQRLP